MYTALILDDEEPARRAIHALGTWEEHRISSVVEAKDGLEGMHLIATLQPNLIFVDMRMPFIGGVELLQKAKAISSGKFIVVSGFDDFAYARGAITSGALDYLLKPVKKTELNQAIAKAVAQLDHEQTERNIQLSEAILQNISMPLVKEKIFASIIDQNGKFHKIKELEHLLEAKPEDQFQIIIITMLNLNTISQEKFRGDLHACNYAIANALNELLSAAGQPFSFKNSKEEQEFIIVMSLDDSSSPSILPSIEATLVRLNQTFGTEGIAAIGIRAERLDQLDASYQSSKSYLQQANLLEPQTVYTHAALNSGQRSSILTKKDLLLHALETGSTVYAMNVIRDFFADINDTGCFTIDMMQQCSKEFRVMMDLLKEGKGLSLQHASLLDRFDLLFDNQIMAFKTYTQAILTIMEDWFAILLQNHKSMDKLGVEHIKAYIDHHYFEDISISLFTERYYISKEHLLRLFKQKYGCGLYEYTLQVRMEKAKELLQLPELKIQTVSEKIGYNDTNYFSKAFKKHFGISPLAYRKQSASCGDDQHDILLP